ncbi:hypothetical protein HOY80DRAFT_996139 [Tuber brumale]|nr:hypothetical protein HOY80DRAFT_996139 [Tuber brumale]
METIKQYPDIMAMCGDPNFSAIKFLDGSSKNIDLINGYSSVRVIFNLPDNIKYPPIPVNLDKTISIYPLRGESLITGLELFSALNILNLALLELKEEGQSTDFLRKTYFIKILHGSYIPFNTKTSKPFFSTIEELQRNRRNYKKSDGKGSAMEKIFKDLGNMLYGKVVTGLSNKRTFDSRLLQMKAMTGSYLSNPVIGT